MTEVQAGTRYRIVNAKGGTVIDLSASDGESVVGWDFHGGDNQIWEADSSEDGTWHFKNAANGRYLAIAQEPGDGVKVVGSDEPFGWHIWPDEQDASTLRICLPNTVFNIDLSNHGDSTPGTSVEIWGRWEGVNQTWRFEEA
ncbi:hypothetical protein EST38_g6727 [Candolleomyces aberdarensis]|uniref:Ricin B lectin domain-containing protein n=1 Tax=Candolleomyces aberdarensis TaxID=2316362 RepID=A0A4Q2DGX7_9AGAR|nr:hypothetical protein EST38_g6727 [Candolleomyces aberdarensis]